jgi:hypothetical protein
MENPMSYFDQPNISLKGLADYMGVTTSTVRYYDNRYKFDILSKAVPVRPPYQTKGRSPVFITPNQAASFIFKVRDLRSK